MEWVEQANAREKHSQRAIGNPTYFGAKVYEEVDRCWLEARHYAFHVDQQEA